MNQMQKRLVCITAGVWALALSASAYKFKLHARGSLKINLTTDPKTVRVSVDGEPTPGMIDTPQTLTLSGGKHRLKVSREGFIAHLVTVEGDGGETFHMDDVVLQRSGEPPLGQVDVSFSDNESHYEIDDGLVKGETTASIPLLTVGEAHVLSLFPRWPEKEPKIRCRFLISSDQEPHQIKVKLMAGRAKFQGCERLKDRRPGK